MISTKRDASIEEKKQISKMLEFEDGKMRKSRWGCWLAALAIFVTLAIHAVLYAAGVGVATSLGLFVDLLVVAFASIPITNHLTNNGKFGKDLRADLITGKVKVLQIDVARIVYVSDPEDFGDTYFFEDVNGKVAMLSGQYLYDMPLDSDKCKVDKIVFERFMHSDHIVNFQAHGDTNHNVKSYDMDVTAWHSFMSQYQDNDIIGDSLEAVIEKLNSISKK